MPVPSTNTLKNTSIPVPAKRSREEVDILGELLNTSSTKHSEPSQSDQVMKRLRIMSEDVRHDGVVAVPAPSHIFVTAEKDMPLQVKPCSTAAAVVSGIHSAYPPRASSIPFTAKSASPCIAGAKSAVPKMTHGAQLEYKVRVDLERLHRNVSNTDSHSARRAKVCPTSVKPNEFDRLFGDAKLTVEEVCYICM
jgi:hypothetical protein